MEKQTMLDYETIRAIVAGEKWAVEKVVACYQGGIDRQATVKKRQTYSPGKRRNAAGSDRYPKIGRARA